MRHALSTAATPERGLLEAAQAGDEYAFRELVEPLRPELHAHCYRMLGSVHDADDALQDTLLRAWRALPGFEGRSSLRAWLYRIATNSCLKLIAAPTEARAAARLWPGRRPARRARRRLAEVAWLEPYPEAPDASYEQREGVELAFVAALQHLPPRQRAVLILRDVLGFSAGEVGEALHAAPDAVYSILQRAHRRSTSGSPSAASRRRCVARGRPGAGRLVERFVEAWENADVDAILDLLADDATIAMPPRPSWYRGHEAIRAFLAGWPLSGERRWRLVAGARERAARVRELRDAGGRRRARARGAGAHARGRRPDSGHHRVPRAGRAMDSGAGGISVRNGGHDRHAKGDTWKPRPASPPAGSSR